MHNEIKHKYEGLSMKQLHYVASENNLQVKKTILRVRSLSKICHFKKKLKIIRGQMDKL